MKKITYKLGEVESRFADIVWENAPLTSRELVAHCAEKLNWKKSTTYTVLKKLCVRGFFENEKGTVRVVTTKAEYEAMQSEQFVEENFQGSLPAFVAAFTTRQSLSETEIAEIRRMIENAEE
ncbi:MAG: BlaI/MecI/CopY family transcriptional regulator [Candidatus Fimenecus sp.]